MLLSSGGATPPSPGNSAPTIPPQLQAAAAAAVTVWAADADGNRLAGGGGVFVTADEAVVPLSAIEGASRADVAAVGMNAAARVDSVNRVDREHRLAVVRVSGGRGTPFSVPSGSPAKSGDRIKLVGIGSDRAVRFFEGALGPGDQNTLEVRTAETAAATGWVVARETGEFVGLLADGKGAGRFAFVPARAISDLMKKKAASQPIEVAGAKEVLFDFRGLDDDPDRPTLSPQEEDGIFTAVFGPKPSAPADEYVACEEEHDKCFAADRAAWRMDPKVAAAATGAFTQPGTEQKAYLILANEAGASHADNFGTKRLAIFDGQRLVVDVDIGDHWDIMKTPDLNRGGTSELLLGGLYSGMGSSIWWAELVEFRAGKKKAVKDFDKVYTEDCNSIVADKKIFGTQILYTPGARGSFPSGFRQDVYRSSCGDKPSWKYLPGGSIPSL